ncbi:MAG: hypothetical protein V4512_06615 [Pseudomonadota bacterium]
MSKVTGGSLSIPSTPHDAMQTAYRALKTIHRKQDIAMTYGEGEEKSGHPTAFADSMQFDGIAKQSIWFRLMAKIGLTPENLCTKGDGKSLCRDCEDSWSIR